MTSQKLVELIAAVQTSEETLSRARAYASACGKGAHHVVSSSPFISCLPSHSSCSCITSPVLIALSTARGDIFEGRSWLRGQRAVDALHQRGAWSYAHSVSRGRHAYRKAHCECTGNHDAREGNSRTGIWRDDRLNLLDSFQGIATREDIDKTLKLGMNHPMGPLQLGLFSAASSSPCSC